MPIKKPKRKTKYAKRKRHPEYMAWIATQPCCICGFWPVEVAHVGKRGLGQKCSDLETLPLCANHHREGPEAIHTLGKKFWDYHEIDREEMISKYQRMCEAAGLVKSLAAVRRYLDIAQAAKQIKGEL